MGRTPQPVLQLKNIYLRNGDTQVLNGLDFDLYGGEIHAVVGERGSGKSGLVQLLSGDKRKQRGTLLLHSRSVESLTPQLSFKNGIGVVFQYSNLIGPLSVLKNVFVGRVSSSWLHPHVVWRLKDGFKQLATELGLQVESKLPAEGLGVSQKALVELIRAVLFAPSILVIDEISSKLGEQELDKVFGLLDRLRSQGIAVLYVANKVDEVFRIADRVTVMKSGQRRGTELVKNLDRFKLLRLAYSFVFNIGEDEKATRQLLMIKQISETLINDLPMGILVLDSTHRIFLANRTLYEVLQLSEHHAKVMGVKDLFSATGSETAEQIMEAVIAKRRQVWERVGCGEQKHVKIKVFPYRDEDANDVGTIFLVEDVSLDYFVREYIARAERVTSIAELAAGVAHEINNPLGIIQNYVELLKAKPMDEDSRVKLGKIQRELIRIVDITGSLLSYSRQQRNVIRRLNLTELLDEVLLLLGHKLHEKTIEVSFTRPEEAAEIVGDENKLKQLFLNLLINSIEAVLDHGRIQIQVTRNEGNDRVRVSIIDNGYGIPEGIRGEIFTPFFSTKLNRKNTGLGLSICQNIVETHRGSLTFTSEPGNQTCFTVNLPI